MDTPHVAVDRTVLRRNIDAMATATRDAGLDLRPHAKTHKCAEIGRMQLDAGAVGLTVATIGEAQAFAAAGFDDLFIAYPLYLSGDKARRLTEVAGTASVRVAVDSVEGAVAMADALGDARDRLEVLVEVDSGHHRTGIAPARAGEVAQAAVDVGLRVIGVFTFPGHGYSPDARSLAARQERDALASAADELTARGIDAGVRSGGSTPTVGFADADVLTEVRPGVYPFNDAQQHHLGRAGRDDLALGVVATVVQRGPGRFVLDAGSKVLGSERPAYVDGHGMLPDHPGTTVVALSEHHATVETTGTAPGLGSIVRVVPNHVCITVNLVDELVVTDGGVEVDRWRVIARGANA
ncbi:alanine racemase [Williamsia deligens]|uniref:Alanine racemase n=1 Tax=Williamsia deligens TaxID=321325 RepID=A0ABW3G840_9NOCA|nr:alanine racemase [Williamsia deligens]MCP2192354.1 D-serine deaminase, pyridoxal phosphate-dependent [Williamsia deligens]